MKRILYASGGVLAGGAVAPPPVDYASVLAIVESADVISCEGVDDDGKVRQYQLLIGPSSQILSVTTDEPAAEMNVEQAVADFHHRARQRLPSSTDIGDAGARAAESDADATSHASN